MMFADVIVPLNIPGKLTYKVPEKLSPLIAPGMRVIVPVGQRKLYTGIVSNLHDTEPKDMIIKDLIEVLDDAPVVLPKQLELWNWIVSYYLCEPGDVLKSALPSGLRLDSDSFIALNPDFTDFSLLNSREYLVVSELYSRGRMSVNDTGKLIVSKTPQGFIKKMIEKGALILFDEINDEIKVRTTVFIRLRDEFTENSKLSELADSLSRAKNQQKMLFHFIELASSVDLPDFEIAKSALVADFPGGAAAVKALENRGVFFSYDKKVNLFPAYSSALSEKKALNPSQEVAIQSIRKEFETKQTVLLHGITSSGKTEIYIHLIQEYLDKGFQILYLLPEIALTTQIIMRLKAVFGDLIGVYHSEFSDAERSEVWNKCLNEPEPSYRIILGVRSAIFLPFKNLGLIIVDEEHETSFKQHNPAPRYHARDLALILGKMQEARVLLGSATPSIESYYNAQMGKYGYVSLTSRYLDVKLPEILLADVRKARLKKQMQAQFSPLLIQEIQRALDKKEQVILFQNRRGYAPYSICLSCGWIPKCRHCDVSLTHHKHKDLMLCHYCGYSTQPLTVCPECGAKDLEMKGFGTEKLELDLSAIFPNARVLRMDYDTAKRKNAKENIIHSLSEGKTDILVGTQMVTKGLDFEKVSLVGIMDADSMLNFPDFRAHERSYQLMAQVSGRAGRRETQGKVVIQTFSPDHSVVQYVKDNDYQQLAKDQLSERSLYHYPPFYRLIEVSVRHKDRSTVNRAASDLFRFIQSRTKSEILGPEFPSVSMIQNYHIKVMLIKTDKVENPAMIRNVLLKARAHLLALPGFASVQVLFDVDPV